MKKKPRRRSAATIAPKPASPRRGEPLRRKPARTIRPAAELVVQDDRPAPAPIGRVPIVGIGASAGGIEAFTQLLHGLPKDTGMAFVLVQHLAPDHESMLTEPGVLPPVQAVAAGGRRPAVLRARRRRLGLAARALAARRPHPP